MSKKPLHVAFLWHMHQPDYRNSLTGATHLPWTRFHAIKDYYDMGALVEKIDGVHATINVVPSLMDQLVAYADGSARETYAEATLRDASELNDHEKLFLLRSFFQLSPKHMLHPYSRYEELLQRRGEADETGAYSNGLKLYSVQDYRDLQVWYNLSWCGRELRRDPEIAALLQQGRGFSESDKRRLLEIQYAFIGQILPYYRRLSDRGSWSPGASRGNIFYSRSGGRERSRTIPVFRIFEGSYGPLGAGPAGVDRLEIDE